MLSSMTTPLGVTVIGPSGHALRLPASHPAFRTGCELLQAGLPGEQTWQKLQELVANPLKAMASWCDRFGVTIVEDDDFITLNDLKLSRAKWLPLLTRLEATGGSPGLALRLAAKLGATAAQANVADVCIHVQRETLNPLGLLKLEYLPADARPGDKVEVPANTGLPFIVSYASVSADEEGVLALCEGVVLSKVDVTQVEGLKYTMDALAQPGVIGHNQTYRCEQGSSTGWLEDFSFDSLAQARLNAAEMSTEGSEVRIINRITGELVSIS